MQSTCSKPLLRKSRFSFPGYFAKHGWGATRGANNKMNEKAAQELKDLATISWLSIAVSY